MNRDRRKWDAKHKLIIKDLESLEKQFRSKWESLNTFLPDADADLGRIVQSRLAAARLSAVMAALEVVKHGGMLDEGVYGL